ncbi:MAG: hypothetical protein IJ697_06900 [Synergistaceae bacterium]|nr:hypothetical protein [Synergistaceae bacterium]
MFEQIKIWAVEQVMWAEKNLKDKDGSEKKAAVIKKLDEMITLPSYLEWVDDVVLAWLVDKACQKLNEFSGRSFGDIELSEREEKEIADEIENPKEGEVA